jgi:hypothetical protein
MKPVFVASCVCGKICTSKPGLTLHQHNCEQAKEHKTKGGNGLRKLDVVEPEIAYIKDVQEVVDLMKSLAVDAHYAIIEGNKSAGRRARSSLNILKKRITPLRKKILTKIRD